MSEQPHLSNEQIKELNGRIEDTNKNVMRVLEALLPDELTKRGGLIQDIDRMDKRVEKVEDEVVELRRIVQENHAEFRQEKNKIYWTITIIATLSAALITAAAIWKIFFPN